MLTEELETTDSYSAKILKKVSSSADDFEATVSCSGGYFEATYS
jgi:hypothetical protein